MVVINIGQKNVSSEYAQFYIIRNALMYLRLYPKNLHYQKMNRYLKDTYKLNADLYSICYYIISRCKVTWADKNYNVVISPKDEHLYRLITYGNRDIRGLDIINNALTLAK